MQRYRSGYNGPDSKSGVHASVPWVRIPPAAPNKHRDFDTKSRCSFFVSKPKNIRVFKVSRLKPSPAELFSTGDYVLFIGADAHPYNS